MAPERSVDLPFAFPYYGQTYASAYVNRQGVIDFQGECGSACWVPTNSPPPVGPAAHACIFGFWEDLRLDASSSVRTAVVGSGASQGFVIEYHDLYIAGVGDRLTFSVTLWADGDIDLQYQAIQADAGGEGDMAGVGMSSPDGADGMAFSWRTDEILRSGLNIRVTRP